MRWPRAQLLAVMAFRRRRSCPAPWTWLLRAFSDRRYACYLLAGARVGGATFVSHCSRPPGPPLPLLVVNSAYEP